MKTNTIEQLFVEELKDIYDAEKQLVKALPQMAKAARSSNLREAFSSHLEETKGHVERLEEVFASIGETPAGKTCAAMKGLIAEGNEMSKLNAGDAFHDSALIGAAQRVEHYEMAAYGTARTLAEHLGNPHAVELLQETLDEEREADEKLTSISMGILGNWSSEGEMSGETGPTDRSIARPKARRAGDHA
jgi:ferritin-like metal-binding protein YciE